MEATERLIGIRNTRALIRANPTTAQFNRPQFEHTDAGGIRRLTPLVLTSQTFRIVPMSGLVWDRSVTTPDEGEVSDVTLQLIGMPDIDVMQLDWFEHRNGFAQVTHVSPVEGYRREARLNWYKSESELE